MLSTNIKRSVATLGVVAGLLAAAVPASAQMVDGPVLAKAKAGINSEVEPVELRAASRGDSSLGNPVTLDVASSEVFELNTFGGDDTLSAQGTQVGSEGVKAPTRADDQVKVSGYTYNPKEITID